jgi:hypothetical protein
MLRVQACTQITSVFDFRDLCCSDPAHLPGVFVQAAGCSLLDFAVKVAFMYTIVFTSAEDERVQPVCWGVPSVTLTSICLFPMMIHVSFLVSCHFPNLLPDRQCLFLLVHWWANLLSVLPPFPPSAGALSVVKVYLEVVLCILANLLPVTGLVALFCGYLGERNPNGWRH